MLLNWIRFNYRLTFVESSMLERLKSTSDEISQNVGWEIEGQALEI